MVKQRDVGGGGIEAAAWRSREILAALKQVRDVSAMYGQHFPAARVGARMLVLCTPRANRHE